MAELADAGGLNPPDGNILRVRFPLRALFIIRALHQRPYGVQFCNEQTEQEWKKQQCQHGGVFSKLHGSQSVKRCWHHGADDLIINHYPRVIVSIGISAGYVQRVGLAGRSDRFPLPHHAVGGGLAVAEESDYVAHLGGLGGANSNHFPHGEGWPH